MNLLDYLKVQFDSNINKLTDADILVFSKLVYLPFEYIMDSDETITISEAYSRVGVLDHNLYISKKDISFFKLVSQNDRYKNLKIGRVISKMSDKLYEQFMAITIFLDDNDIFVSFRGTSKEMYGFREDFMMLYKTVLAQNDAINYLNQCCSFKSIYVGGHSKGGYLGMYASSKALPSVKKKIKKIYNLDGPGFMELDKDYYSIKDKIITYLPSTSIIGRLYKNDCRVEVISSSKRLIKQHDLYSWILKDGLFILSDLDEDSDNIKYMIDKIIFKDDSLKINELIEYIFDSISSSGVSYVSEFHISDLLTIISSYNFKNDSSKIRILKVIKYLFSA